MKLELVKQHEWLRKFVGEWTFESECPMGPGGEKVKTSGSESVRMLGDAWMVGEGRGEMPGGGEGRWLTVVGYDKSKEQFVGSWMGSMMTNMFVYNGFLDDAQKVLTLETEGPSFTDPTKTAKFRDITEFKSDTHRVMTSKMLGDDGKWQQFMEAHYRRTK